MAGNPAEAAARPGPAVYVALLDRSLTAKTVRCSSSLFAGFENLQHCSAGTSWCSVRSARRLGWREPVRAVNTSCPATTARALHAGHLVLWHARARKGGNQLSGAGGRGVGQRLGAPATETGGSVRTASVGGTWFPARAETP